MVNVSSSSDAAEKWSRRASAAGQDYESGVRDVSDSEQREATINAASRYEQGVQDALANNSFERGVSDSPKSWQENAIALGQQRYGQGVSQNQDTYSASVQPFFDALESLTLPARGPRGSPENYERSAEVGRRLHELRTQG